MKIAGLQKLTLLDFPGKMACTVFTEGCNFRCPFCHNALLVEGDNPPFMSEEEFFSFLNKRQGVLEGVCITGGEPTLNPDLPDFIGKIKSLGFAVKLDTNGFLPGMLKNLIENSLLDYVAMDIKSSKEGYGKAVGIENFNTANIEESVELLKNSGMDFEFRTTVVKELHTEKEIKDMGTWLKGAPKYFLQAFSDSGNLLGEGMHGYAKNEMEDLLKLLKKDIPSAQIRGI